VFWTQVFVLPKKIIHLLEQKLNRFLWCGLDVKAKAKVSWEKICVPKKEGGLGIKRLEVWNKASMMIHIWNLFARVGSLWVAWVEEVWLKGRSFWQIPIPHTCSWSWKKTLKLRGVAKDFLSFKVGDGSKIFLWFDSWHPAGYLLDRYSYRTVYDAGRDIGPKLSSIIRNDEWYWPSARSDNLVEIQSRLPEVVIGGDDFPIWKGSKGVYFCAETWDQLRVKLHVVEWHKVVWFSQAIPRHAFILWLALRDALVTKENMCFLGFSSPSVCMFCYGCIESRGHLFFACSFCRPIWRALMSICLIPNPLVDWKEVIRWFVKDLQGTSLKANACRPSLAAVVYHLWWQRNALLHGNTPRTEEDIVSQVKRQVGSRLLAKGSKQSVGKNLALAYNWNLQGLFDFSSLGAVSLFGTAICLVVLLLFEGFCP
jgi:hypothetical protein